MRLNTSLLKATKGRDLIPITALFKMNVYLLYALSLLSLHIIMDFRGICY